MLIVIRVFIPIGIIKSKKYLFRDINLLIKVFTITRCPECGKIRAISVVPYHRENYQLRSELCECDPTDKGLPTNWLGRDSEKYLSSKKRLIKRRERLLKKDD